MSPDLQTLLYATLGGFFMGSYPLFIKTPSVLSANVAPIVFQLYKAIVVFLCGFLFLIPRAIHLHHITNPDEPLFVFSYWGFASAALWVPSGLCTITSVPLVGMGFQVATACSFSSLLSFVVFTVVVHHGTTMKRHSCGNDCTYYLAPLWLCMMVVGMLSMVFVSTIVQHPWCATWVGPKMKVCDDDGDDGDDGDDDGDGVHRVQDGGRHRSDRDLGIESQHLIKHRTTLGRNDDPTRSIQASMPQPSQRRAGLHDDITSFRPPSTATWTLGVLLSISSGAFSSCQYGVVEWGKEQEMARFNCSTVLSNHSSVTTASAAATPCPWQVTEQFNQQGSWFVSFGIGALVVTVLLLGVSVACNGGRCPSMHWHVLKTAGLSAGLFWVVGNAFITLAVTTGGNAVGVPQSLAAMLITSGSWGMLYYKEGGSVVERYVWVFFALFTLVAMVLLGLEKVAS
jgi:hypothetical protein